VLLDSEGSHGDPHFRADCRSLRYDLVAAEARRKAGGPVMSVMEWIGVVLSIAVAIYLFIALLYPEKFE
jgi:K+-transporting ATPase KdpF subunit